MLSLVHSFIPISTNDPSFDNQYSLLIKKNSINESIFIPYALKLQVLMDKYLLKIPKIPVGQSTYLCILSFIDDYCFIRFDKRSTAIEKFYLFARELQTYK